MSTGSALEPLSPAERASCVAAARMHYLEDRSKTDIAELKRLIGELDDDR